MMNLLSCKKQNSDDDNKVSVFVGILLFPLPKGNITVRVNDSLLYDGVYIDGKGSYIGNCMFISKIPKSNTKYHFYIKALDQDTSFVYDMSGVDSIVVSLTNNEDFSIFDNREKMAWATE